VVDQVDDRLGHEKHDCEDEGHVKEASQLRLVERGGGVLAVEVGRSAAELKLPRRQVRVLPLLCYFPL
jgi:hypothetical protein